MIQRVASGRDLSYGAVSDLEATLIELASRGVTGLFLDTERVLSFDSESLEALVELDAAAKARNLHFAVVNPSDVLRIALEITGLTDAVEVRVDDDDAAEYAAAEAAAGAPAAAPSRPREDAGVVTRAQDEGRPSRDSGR